MIRFLHRKDIDDERWDHVIAASVYETVYARTWYLDACAEEWGALIMPDYEYVMPVAFRKKLGFKYLYQPRFCQQLGVYSEKLTDSYISKNFLLSLKKYFNLGDYAFNEGNLVGQERGFSVSDHTNYTLHLIPAYEDLNRGYSVNCRRNVRKAYQSGLGFSDEVSIGELVQLKKQHDHIRLSDEHYNMLTNMFSGMKKTGNVKAYGVKVKGTLCAGAIFAFCDKRIHYLLSVSSEAGKEHSGMFMVIDKLIQLHAGKTMYLDFEGSNIPSIARFFTGFGAIPHLYQRISIDSAAGKLIQKVRKTRTHGR